MWRWESGCPFSAEFCPSSDCQLPEASARSSYITEDVSVSPDKATVLPTMAGARVWMGCVWPPSLLVQELALLATRGSWWLSDSSESFLLGAAVLVDLGTSLSPITCLDDGPVKTVEAPESLSLMTLARWPQSEEWLLPGASSSSRGWSSALQTLPALPLSSAVSGGQFRPWVLPHKSHTTAPLRTRHVMERGALGQRPWLALPTALCPRGTCTSPLGWAPQSTLPPGGSSSQRATLSPF